MDMDKLMAIVSQSRSGYLKPWKAQSMLGTLNQIPDIRKDYDRLLKYVNNSLAMEGFRSDDVEAITAKLYLG